jgi:two-component system nitrogen regulation response regulator GlnG/two-component system response regulator HydG
VLALAVVWSRTEPARIGEVALPEYGADVQVFGRAPWVGGQPLTLVRQRFGTNIQCAPLEAPSLSRVQLLVRPEPTSLVLSNVGQLPMLHDGRPVTQLTARAGDVVQLGDELVLLVVCRPRSLPDVALPDALVPAFGRADAFGLIGESAAIWELRRQLAFAAIRDDHVLITGPSGSGKELVARAMHRLSRRVAGPLVTRSAATFPDGLIDAELFGNARDYPNPGMAERPGLVGSADGGTLFLDEIGELSHGLQAHLLRVLDAGEYQRLGDGRSRMSRMRLVAATNRGAHALKHDFAARLRLRIAVPGLDDRREDVPLLARHVLRELAVRDDDLARRFFQGGDPAGEPRWTARLVAALLTRSFTTHVRELAALLWDAMLHSPGDILDVPRSAAHRRAAASPDPAPGDEPGAHQTPAHADPGTLDAARVKAALDECSGVQERAWRMLGLRSRYQLIRLLRKHGLSAATRKPRPSPVTGG